MTIRRSCLLLFLVAAGITPVLAAGSIKAGGGAAHGFNTIAVSIFVLFIAITLYITWWAAKHSRSAKDFYAAGGRIGGFQNGLAIAGDFMSAATFLGVTGLVFARGLDAVVYSLSALVGLSLLLFTLVEPFRNLGRYTLADVASYRLNKRPMRGFTALTSLVVVLMYLITQMVGFVENQHFQLVEREIALEQMVEHASRRTDHDVRAPFERINLRTVSNAAVDCHRTKASPPAKNFGFVRDLSRQFTGGHQYQRLALILLGVESLQHR